MTIGFFHSVDFTIIMELLSGQTDLTNNSDSVDFISISSTTTQPSYTAPYNDSEDTDASYYNSKPPATITSPLPDWEPNLRVPLSVSETLMFSVLLLGMVTNPPRGGTLRRVTHHEHSIFHV